MCRNIFVYTAAPGKTVRVVRYYRKEAPSDDDSPPQPHRYRHEESSQNAPPRLPSRTEDISIRMDPEDPQEGAAILEGGGLWHTICVHVKRVTIWQLTEAKPLPSEAKRLQTAGIENNVLLSFLAWRHSMLLVALPAVFFSALLSWIELSQLLKESQLEGFSAFGKIVWLMPYFAETVLFITVMIVLCMWGRWRITSKMFKIGWGLAFLMPFVPALFPLQFLAADGWTADPTMQIVLAIMYAIDLFPVLITFPSSLARASLRIRGLLPEATLSSWILVISAPFQSIMFLMALILLIQVAGNIALILGSICLVISPWIYVIRRRLYIHAPTEETEKQLGRTQFVIGNLARLGFICFIAWAFTGNIGGVRILGSGEDSVFGYAGVFRVLFQMIGRQLVNTTMFSDVLLRMTVTNWRQDKNRREEDNGNHIDSLFADIESSISRAEKADNKNDTSEGSSDDEESEYESEYESDDDDSYV